jgi:hypothetical protein
LGAEKPTLSRSFRIHAPQKIFTHCCRASSPIELRKSAASLPRSRILAAIVVAGIVAGVVLQWQCRRRYAATGGDDEKDSSAAAAKENAPVTLGGSEDRRSGGVQGGEVFLAVDDGFGVDLEELLRASAYVVVKSRGGIVYSVVSVHGAAVAVRRLSEPYDGDGADECRRRRCRAFKAEAARATPNVACLSGAPAVYAPPSSPTPCFDEVPRVRRTCIVGGYGEEREHGRKGAPTRSP